MIFVVTDKATRAFVHEYQHSEPVEWDGMSFTTHDHTAQPEEPPATVPTKFNGRRILTKLEFRSLFPESALLGVDRFEAQFEAAGFLTDAQRDEIRTSFNDYHAAEDVNLDDPRWLPGLGLYVALGLMTQADLDEVLYG